MDGEEDENNNQYGTRMVTVPGIKIVKIIVLIRTIVLRVAYGPWRLRYA